MRFDSFNEVVSWYERTRPMVSKHHTLAHDVRPIGDRKRKWERIKKIDENTYALLDGTFTRVGEALKVEVTTVDKELKKQWRERLDSFYTYCAAVAPMLDVTWSGKNEYANQIKEHLIAEQKGNLRGAWVRDTKSLPVEFVREVMTQEDHPMRVALAALVISDIGGKRAIESQDDVRSIKAAYNRVMNKALGFYKIEEK